MQSYAEDSLKTTIKTDLAFQLTMILASCMIVFTTTSLGMIIGGGSCLYAFLAFIFAPR